MNNKNYPIYALNENAANSVIDTEKTPYAFYSFHANSPLIEKALSIEIESVFAAEGKVSFGFLFENDFIAKNQLKEELASRNMISASLDQKKLTQYDISNKKAVLAIKIPEDALVKGFFVESSIPLKIISVEETAPFYGWLYKNGVPHFSSFSESFFNVSQTDFDLSPVQNKTGKITVYFDEIATLDAQQPVVNLSIANQMHTIRLAPQLKQATFYTSQLSLSPNSPLIIRSKTPLRGFTFIEENNVAELSPLTADIGLMLRWDQQTWRKPEFELFSWESFPSILVFDTLDYKIQDNFFKRLAFFVEKSGYRGKIMSLKDIAALHAFNAHDYKAADLAAFFTQAQLEGSTLTNEENILLDILLVNHVITKSENGYNEGVGAVLSISRESPAYLREVLMVHEGLHGLFFIDGDFRNEVKEEFHKMDAQSLEFLLQYFVLTPSLAYDLTDTYLVYNEFMAYALQQAPSNIKKYFTENLANRQFIRRARPDLIEYLIETEGRAFTLAGENLSRYIYDRWGYFGGRITLITK
ncbi:MAG: hypothetical protein ACRC4W_07380 [Treponemataceae bacterium]